MLVLLLAKLDSEEDRLQFTQIYLNYKQLLLKTAVDCLEQPSEAADCVQEAFLELTKRFDHFKGLSEAAQKSYLITICKRCAFRMNQKQLRFSAPVSETEKTRLPDLLSDPLQDVSCTRMDLVDALHSLDEPTLQMLLMRYVEGYSSKEIGAQFGLQADVVRQRLHRARKLIAKTISKKEGDLV